MKVRTNEVSAEKLYYLTVNREYEVEGILPDLDDALAGNIIGDEGKSIFILFDGCAHLDGRAWEVVQE